jgi:hypothetical protein
MPANSPVNTDAREPSVSCSVFAARAGYWERYVAGVARHSDGMVA